MPKRTPTLPEEEREQQGQRRLTICLAVSVARALQHEAIDRRLTYGEIIEEALASRMVLIQKGSPREPGTTR